MAARGVGEEGRDILFDLLAREAQLQKVGRTKGPMRLALPTSNYSKRRFFFYRFDATALFFHKHSLWFSLACADGTAHRLLQSLQVVIDLDLLRILSRCNFQHRQSVLVLFHYLPPQI